MSWGIEVTGTKDAVKAKVVEYLDKSAASYKDSSPQECADILAAKERILSLVDALDLSADQYTNWNGVIVKGGGSHSSTSGKVLSASFQVSVQRTSLAL